MKAQPKGLQKLTDSEIKEREIINKINGILDLDKVMPGDIEDLSDEETDSLHSEIIDKLNKLKGDERAIFVNKVESILSNSVKNQLWEFNHAKITQIISAFISENGRMPTKGEIALEAELSRQTVHKHIKDYSTHPQYLLHAEQFRFMSAKVLAKVFQFAINGDTSAAKLYFNVVGMTGQNALISFRLFHRDFTQTIQSRRK